MTYLGSCLCGLIKFELAGAIDSIIYCHCSLCQKASGTAFATNGFVNTAEFRIVAGESDLSRFESKPGRERYFCGSSE